MEESKECETGSGALDSTGLNDAEQSASLLEESKELEKQAKKFYDDHLIVYTLLNKVDPATAKQAIQIMADFAEYQTKELQEKLSTSIKFQSQHLKCVNKLSKEVERLEGAGKEATSLIAHLKDQYGFNDEEESSQNKIMSVFKYEGDW